MSPGYTITISAAMVMIISLLDLQLPVQSVPTATKVVSTNPTHVEVYSIQHYLIKRPGDTLDQILKYKEMHDNFSIKRIQIALTLTPTKMTSL